MRLTKARVQGYRSIIDTGYFDVPSNSIVIGNPGKIILNRPDATDKYIKNIIEDISS